MKNWKVILWLVLFFPLGAYFMWRYSSWNIHLKYGISIFLGLLTALFTFTDGLFILFWYSSFGFLLYFIATFKSSPKKQKISFLTASVLLFGSSLALSPTTESVESDQSQIQVVKKDTSASDIKKQKEKKASEEKLAAENKIQAEKELQAEKLKEATDALILAEATPTRENYNKASTLVVALTTKDSTIVSRLDTVKQTVEAEEKIVAEAKEKAETERIAAEEARIAEEQRVQEAQRVAEEQRLANERAVAEENRVAQAAAAAPQQDNTGQRVLVTPTGSKYHIRKCGNGTYTDASLEDALSRGLEPCSKCF